MKLFLTAGLFLVTSFTSFSQDKNKEPLSPDKNKELQTVEASCGQCQFGLPGKSCDLAVRIKGKAYFVDGSNIDSHGDAHANDGFCSAIRKANVQGEVVDGRFKATYFKLMPEKPKNGKDKQ